MASDLSSGFRLGASHISLQTHKTQPRGWKKITNEQIRTWVSSKRKRREFVTLLCSSPCICRRAFADVHLRETSTKPLGMLTCLLTALFCRPVSSAPLCWLSSSALLCQLTLSVFSGTFLPSSTSCLVGDLALRPFVWVSRQNRKRDPEWYPHKQKRMLPIVSHLTIFAVSCRIRCVNYNAIQEVANLKNWLRSKALKHPWPNNQSKYIFFSTKFKISIWLFFFGGMRSVHNDAAKQSDQFEKPMDK